LQIADSSSKNAVSFSSARTIAEVILYLILKRVSIPILFFFIQIGLVSGSAVIVYHVMLRDSRERKW